MNDTDSTLKKTITPTKSGKKLGKYEDPLVCKLCNSNDIHIIDIEINQIYCNNCGTLRQLLDKSNIPEQSLVKTKKYWENRFQKWRKGEDLTQTDLQKLQETIYSTYYFNKPDKRRKLKDIANTMEVDINES